MKRRRFTYCIAIAIFIASCLPLTAICQQDFNANTAMNWTVEQTFISPTVSSTPDHIPFKANFFDGLGRRIQTIEGSLGGDIQCVADYVEYNVRGQICRQWLPAPASDKAGSFTSLRVLKNEYEDPTSAFQQSLYEDTPSARIIESRKPGLDSWGTYSGITSQYLYNTTSGDFSCMRLCVKDGKLSCPGLYDKGELQVTETTDEDDNRIIEFKDIWNQCVLSRSITKSGTVADTYYAYDVYGRLRVIISPKGSLSIKKGWQTSLTDNNLTSIAHTFEYDDYGRISRMSVPGAGSSRFAYTYSGKTCYSQNPIQALDGSWAYQTYDGLGRPAYSGTLKVESGAPVESFSHSNSTYFSPQEETAIFGYHRALSWAKEENCLSADFYDDYSFLNLFPEQEQQLAYTANLGFGLRGDTGTSGFTTKGHKTGSVRRIIKPDNTEELLITAYYYDNQGRVIQTRSNNHMGGTEVTFNALSFDGRVTQARTAHSSENASVSATHLYTYDCLGAPKTISYKGSTPVTELIAYEYDELHRINHISMLDNMLPVEYTYTPEGALESISSVPFSQTLFREKRPDGSQGYLNGLVSAQNFSICSTSPGVDTPDTQGVDATYNYTYDGMRLMSAMYEENSRRVPLPVNSRWRPDLHYRPNYSSIYNYDTNGNITELTRFGHVDTEVITTSFGAARFNQNRHLYDLVDDLTLKYDGNRLIKVSDSAEDSDLASSNDFVDGKDSGNEYEYDAMGRLIRDDNKGITLIKYNVLGLPSDIFVNTCHIRYTYDADCRLLRKEYGHDALKLIEPTTPFGAWITQTVFEQTSSQDWSGNCEYLDGKFSRCFHSAGWIDSHGKHTAVVKDYQGNIRATWKEGDYVVANPEESQRAKSMLYSNVTGYYPYGLPWSNMQGSDRYLYSGKDLDRTNGLMLYDFHARLYDPQLGRFLQPDPCSSAYASHSPWLYCLANPIMCTDPSGMTVFYDEEGKFFKYKNDGTDDKAMLVPGYVEENKSKFHGLQDACKEYMVKKGLYLIITPELISQIEEIGNLTETNNQEYGFGMFTDGAVSSIKSGESNHVELQYTKSELLNDKGKKRKFQGEIHTHNFGPTWIEEEKEWQYGLTGPSKTDMKNFKGKIGVVIGYSCGIEDPNETQSNRYASPVYNNITQKIGFYNKKGLLGTPIVLEDALKTMRDIMKESF